MRRGCARAKRPEPLISIVLGIGWGERVTFLKVKSAMKALVGYLFVVLFAFRLTAEDKLPVPDAAKQREAEKTIKEVFKDEYAKTTPDDRAALSKKLLKQAEESNDDKSAVYVLWREACNAAALAGDLDTPLAIIDQMSTTFKVDVIALKKAALTTVTANTKDADVTKAINGINLLLDKPDDPAGNTLVGKYLCFRRSAWDKGLPFLAKCNDAAVKTAAEKELLKPKEAQVQVAVGDCWWDLAEKETDKTTKSALLERARFWYEKSLPSLAGLVKAKVEKRLIRGPKTVDLIPFILLDKDIESGTWKLESNTLIAEHRGNLKIRYQPPDEYDFTIVFVQPKECGGIEQWMMAKDRKQFSWYMGGPDRQNKVFKFTTFKPNDPTVVNVDKCFEIGHTYTSVIKVRNDSVSAYLDGKLIAQFKTNDPNFGGAKLVQRPLGLSTRSEKTVFKKVELLEITGNGKRCESLEP